MNKEVYFKPCKDLSIDSNDVESLCIEMHLKKDRNVLFNVKHRPPNGDMIDFNISAENYFSQMIKH